MFIIQSAFPIPCDNLFQPPSCILTLGCINTIIPRTLFAYDELVPTGFELVEDPPEVGESVVVDPVALSKHQNMVFGQPFQANIINWMKLWCAIGIDNSVNFSFNEDPTKLCAWLDSIRKFWLSAAARHTWRHCFAQRLKIQRPIIFARLANAKVL